MVEPGDPDARASAALYLATVLRTARSEFRKLGKKSYPQFEFNWSLNVGVPSSGFSEPATAKPTTSQLREGFVAAARAAWHLSEETRALSLEAAKDALIAGGQDMSLPVYVIPEIVAAAEGYRRSAFARPGVHTIIDIGASTLDLCAFILQPGSSDKPFGCAVPVVAQLGTALLHDARLRGLDGHASRGPICGIDPRSPDAVVPDSLADYLAPPDAAVPEELKSANRAFQSDCELALRRAVGGMYLANPLADYKLIPLFITGGGGRMRFYADVVDNVRVSKQSVAWHNLRSRSLERPDDLLPDKLTSETVTRLMVAYGLSFPRIDFGDPSDDGGGFRGFTDPMTIPAIDPAPPRRLDRYFVSKDQV